MAKLGSSEEDVFTRLGAMMPTVNEIIATNDSYLRVKLIETSV